MILFFSFFLFSNCRLLDELPSKLEGLKALASKLDTEDTTLTKYQNQLKKLSEEMKTIQNDKTDYPFKYDLNPIKDFNYSSNYQQVDLFEWSPYGKKKLAAFFRALKPSILYTFFKIFPSQKTNYENGWKYSGSKGNFTFVFEESNKPLFKTYKKIDSILIKNENASNCSINTFYIYTYNVEGNEKFGPFKLDQGFIEIPIKSNKSSKGFRIIVNENNGDEETCLENGVYVKQ